MQVKPYTFPQRKGTWLQQWNGLYSNKEYGHVDNSSPEPGTANYLEQCCILSVIEPLVAPRMMELGAGWGRQTLTVAGVKGKGTFYAVEADPTHFQWLQQVVEFNRLAVTTIFGAVSDVCGWTKFNTETDTPDKWYGQHIKATGNLSVPKYSLDYLFKTFNINELDFLHMDVQGEELKVIKGGQGAIKNIQYIYIELHRNRDIDEIIKLAPNHKNVLCLPKASGKHKIPGFDAEVVVSRDGLLLLEKK